MVLLRSSDTYTHIYNVDIDSGLFEKRKENNAKKKKDMENVTEVSMIKVHEILE